MKLTHPEIDTVFDTDNGLYNTLVIEAQEFMVRLLEDITRQLQGFDGDSVLSMKNSPVAMSKNALLDSFVPFELNRKPLLSLITARLSKRAMTPEYFEKTAKVLAEVELWLDDLAYDFPCDIVFPNVSTTALIKAVTPEVRGEGNTIAERTLDYMELVEEFDRPRLFFTLNMRSYVNDEEMERFAKTAISHGYQIIGIESSVHPMLTVERRTIIDADLCEIG